MKRFSIAEAIVICFISIIVGLAIGSKNCTSIVTDDCLEHSRLLSNEVDSLDNEILQLRIELGRYEIIHTRLLDEFPEVESKVTENLE